MKIFYYFFFLLILSCGTIKKEYVCGDHPCVDKKEFNEYFSKNFIIEIKSPNKKNKKIDLVKQNTLSSSEDNNDKKISKKEKKIKLKEEKKKLKAQRTRLLEERKIKEIAQKKEKNKKIPTPKSVKSKTNDTKLENNSIINNREVAKKLSSKTSTQNIKKNLPINSIKTKNTKSICNKIEDCDIDKISELLIKKGKNKPFPNISSN